MGVVTGKGLSDLIREKFGVKITFYLMILILLTNFGNIIRSSPASPPAWSSSASASTSRSRPGPASSGISSSRASYKSVEKIFLVACVFYVSYIISGFMVKPPTGAKSRSEIIRPSIQFRVRLPA